MKSEIGEITVTLSRTERYNVITALSALIRGDATIDTLNEDQINDLNDLWNALEHTD